MKVEFLNTSGRQNDKPSRIDPLGPLYLLTILEEEFGDRLDLGYTDLRGINEDSMIYHIPERDVYLHYVTTPEIAEIRRITTAVRGIYPNALHPDGGQHPNMFPEESLETFATICIGEGEQIIKQMTHDIFNKELKQVYRQSGQIDLKAYPFSLRQFLPKSAIADIGMLSRKHYDLLGTTVLCSRGCPFGCHFCFNQYEGTTRVRSPGWIAKTIEYLKKECHIMTSRRHT